MKISQLTEVITDLALQLGDSLDLSKLTFVDKEGKHRLLGPDDVRARKVTRPVYLQQCEELQEMITERERQEGKDATEAPAPAETETKNGNGHDKSKSRTKQPPLGGLGRARDNTFGAAIKEAQTGELVPPPDPKPKRQRVNPQPVPSSSDQAQDEPPATTSDLEPSARTHLIRRMLAWSHRSRNCGRIEEVSKRFGTDLDNRRVFNHAELDKLSDAQLQSSHNELQQIMWDLDLMATEVEVTKAKNLVARASDAQLRVVASSKEQATQYRRNDLSAWRKEEAATVRFVIEGLEKAGVSDTGPLFRSPPQPRKPPTPAPSNGGGVPQPPVPVDPAPPAPAPADNGPPASPVETAVPESSSADAPPAASNGDGAEQPAADQPSADPVTEEQTATPPAPAAEGEVTLAAKNAALEKALKELGKELDSTKVELEVAKAAAKAAQEAAPPVVVQPVVMAEAPLLAELCTRLGVSPATAEALETRLKQLLDDETALGSFRAKLVDQEELQRQMAELRKQIGAAQARQVPEWFIKLIAPFGLDPAGFDQVQLNSALGRLAAQHKRLIEFHNTHQKEIPMTDDTQAGGTRDTQMPPVIPPPIPPQPAPQPVPVASPPPSRLERLKMWHAERPFYNTLVPALGILLVVALVIWLFKTIGTITPTADHVVANQDDAETSAPPTTAEAEETTQPEVVPETDATQAAAQPQPSEYEYWRESYRAQHQEFMEKYAPKP